MRTKGSTVSATARAHASREATKKAMTRELLSGRIFARTWPAYVTAPKTPNASFSLLLCVESPAGLLTYRLSEDEYGLVDGIPRRPNTGENPVDRLPILHALATIGW